MSRYCSRCNVAMIDGFGIETKTGNFNDIIIVDKINRFKHYIPKIAICPLCGEISIYISENDRKKLRNKGLD